MQMTNAILFWLFSLIVANVQVFDSAARRGGAGGTFRLRAGAAPYARPRGAVPHGLGPAVRVTQRDEPVGQPVQHRGARLSVGQPPHVRVRHPVGHQRWVFRHGYKWDLCPLVRPVPACQPLVVAGRPVAQSQSAAGDHIAHPDQVGDHARLVEARRHAVKAPERGGRRRRCTYQKQVTRPAGWGDSVAGPFKEPSASAGGRIPNCAFTYISPHKGGASAVGQTGTGDRGGCGDCAAGGAHIRPVGLPSTRKSICLGTWWYRSAMADGMPTHTTAALLPRTSTRGTCWVSSVTGGCSASAVRGSWRRKASELPSATKSSSGPWPRSICSPSSE
eukprot:scaffold3888_cov115-Isochrysis_galbana.AAC.2